MQDKFELRSQYPPFLSDSIFFSSWSRTKLSWEHQSIYNPMPGWSPLFNLLQICMNNVTGHKTILSVMIRNLTQHLSFFSVFSNMSNMITISHFFSIIKHYLSCLPSSREHITLLFLHSFLKCRNVKE